jgi:hypothetical protein
VLDLEFLAPDSGGFVPMYLSQTNNAIRESNPRHAFSLAPAAATVDSAQSGNLAYTRSRSEGFDVGNLAKNFELHERIVSGPPKTVNGRIVLKGMSATSVA